MRGRKREDLIGKIFGRLTVIGDDPNDKRKAICQCECGNVKSIQRCNLTSGNTCSCGCLPRENASKIGKTYGKIYGKINVKRAVESEKMQRTREINRRFNTNVSRLTHSTPNKNNLSTGVKGIYFNPKKGKYSAKIVIHYKQKFLGYYTKIEDAIKARKRAEEEYFTPIIEDSKQLLRELKVNE